VKKIYILAILVIFCASCGEEVNKRVLIEKLRGLGVLAEPLVSKPSTATDIQTVTLTFYTAMPEEDKIAKVSVFEDDASVLALDVKDLTILDGAASYEKFASLKLYTVQATFTIPPENTLPLTTKNSALRMRYAVKFETQDSDEEKIVGDVWVRPEGADELEWEQPTVEIVEPSKISKSSDEDIKAKITNPNKEDLKIGWYTGDGEIKNRRAKETVWSTGSAKTQTLAVTLRGKKSRGFAIQVKDFKVK
jgi:hypothetical protein